MLHALTHLISAHVYEELTFIPTVQIKILRHWEVKQFAKEHVAGLSGWARTRTRNMCVHHSSSWTPSPGALVSLWYHIHHPVPPNGLSEGLAKSSPPHHACPAMTQTLHIPPVHLYTQHKNLLNPVTAPCAQKMPMILHDLPMPWTAPIYPAHLFPSTPSTNPTKPLLWHTQLLTSVACPVL